MERIGDQKIWSYYDMNDKAVPVSNHAIRKGGGHPIKTYVELARKVAELQFLNRDQVLLFRGQSTDYRTTAGNSLLKAGCFRLENGRIPTPTVLQKRFSILKSAELELVKLYSAKELLGDERIKRHRILRWAILQHYEVCATPLFDVTQSLRIAASFASLNVQSDNAYLFVFGVPNLSGAVTSSTEAGLQTIRLSSACPPDAVRPHLQEGFLLGEYPEISDYDQQAHYNYYEMDFGRRLLAKFRFNTRNVWTDSNFPRTTYKALYAQQQQDHLSEMASEIKNFLQNNNL